MITRNRNCKQVTIGAFAFGDLGLSCVTVTISLRKKFVPLTWGPHGGVSLKRVLKGVLIVPGILHVTDDTDDADDTDDKPDTISPFYKSALKICVSSCLCAK